VSASLSIDTVKHCISRPGAHPSRTTDKVMGGFTGSKTSGDDGAEDRRGEDDRDGDGLPVEVVFFFLLKKPMVVD
jgi:hypothetical protein